MKISKKYPSSTQFSSTILDIFCRVNNYFFRLCSFSPTPPPPLYLKLLLTFAHVLRSIWELKSISITFDTLKKEEEMWNFEECKYCDCLVIVSSSKTLLFVAWSEWVIKHTYLESRSVLHNSFNDLEESWKKRDDRSHSVVQWERRQWKVLRSRQLSISWQASIQIWKKSNLNIVSKSRWRVDGLNNRDFLRQGKKKLTPTLTSYSCNKRNL